METRGFRMELTDGASQCKTHRHSSLCKGWNLEFAVENGFAHPQKYILQLLFRVAIKLYQPQKENCEFVKDQEFSTIPRVPSGWGAFH